MTPYAARLIVKRPAHSGPANADASPVFEATWAELDGQTLKPFDLTPPLEAEDRADLRWYLEKFHQFVAEGTKVKAHRVESRLAEWGERLFKAAFDSADGTHVYRNMMRAAEENRPVLLTFSTTEPEVLAQPWELMRSTEGPLAFQGVSIRRQLTGPKRPKLLELRLPLRLLMIVSRPKDSGFIDPRTSVRPLLDGLDALPEGAVEVEFCEPPTLGEASRRISQARRAKRPFHIVHFDGHGTYLPATGVGALCFEKPNRRVDYVPGRKFGDLLSRLKVPVVILEACQTADLSDRPIFGSVAPALLQAGVGSVVAFSHSVHIEAARILVENFYRELASGVSVGEALAEARVQMQSESERWLALGPNPPTVTLQDWFVPQLYQAGPDLSVVADGVDLAGAEPRRSSADDKPWEANLFEFPPEPNYRFQGRALELLELRRAFQQHNAVVVAGMGGMGKTALSREAASWWLREGRFAAAVFCSFEQVRSLDRLVQIFGQALVGLEFSQGSPEEQVEAAVRLFRERRVLLVWDNFESTLPQYQEGSDGLLRFEESERSRLRSFYERLTSGKPQGRLLVTCRPDDTGLPQIKKVPLSGLERHDSLYLVTSIADLESIDLERKGYEPEKIGQVLDDLEDHPLSISLVIRQLRTLTPDEIRKDFAGCLDQFVDEEAGEGRNRSLRASLKFSTSRLSPAAREVLPWLAWFRGGAMEAQILRFTGLEADAWATVRRELESTALVGVEELARFKTPFVRFHPTLPFAARAGDVPDVDTAEQRFVEVYRGVSGEVAGALTGQAAAAGMELMAREEANARAAIDLAFRRGDRQKGWHIANTLQRFLESAGRRRERDALSETVRSQFPEGAELDGAACAAIRAHAQALFSAGRLEEAVAALQQLAGRLEAEGLADSEETAFQIGTTYSYLGQILVNAGRPRPAIEASQRAVDHLEKLSTRAARGNLSAALGDLANALRSLGRHGEALEHSERAVVIREELEDHRNVAAGHGRCARILMEQGRYAEAETRYGRALDLARRVGDQELIGIIFQQQGGLQANQKRFSSAVALYEQAVKAFQRAGNQRGEMQTYTLLGSTEEDRDEFDAAEAWYARSRELAEAAGDRAHLGAILQNVGVLLQRRAEQTESSSMRDSLLRRAVASIEESLAIWIERRDSVNAASSYSQLGILQLKLGDLGGAEEQLLKSREISESLNLPDVWKDYANLAKVAEARGDAEAAAEWTAKAEAKYKEVQRLARGDGATAALPEKVAEAFLGLAQAVYATRTSGNDVPLDLAETLAQLASQPDPLGAAGLFLQAVIEGGAPTVPSGLPEPLPEIFGGLLASLKG